MHKLAKLLPLLFFWTMSMIVMYWFGWSQDANSMDPRYDIAAKLLRLSEDDRRKREASRKDMAKGMMLLVTVVSIAVVVLSISLSILNGLR